MFSTLFTCPKRSAASLLAELKGNVAITFALAAVPLLLAVALALNYSSALVLKSQLQAATDSTALMLAAQLSDSSAQMLAAANNFLAAQDVGGTPTITQGPTVSSGNTEVCLTTTAANPTSMTKLVATTLVNVSTTACAESSGANLEIAMVLDNSASMTNNTTGGQEKIDALKSAATAFVSSVFANHPTPAGQSTPAVKFSIVPFQDAVALSSADTLNGTAKWIDTQGQSSWHWKGWYGPTDANSGLPAGTVVNSRLDIFNWLVAAGGSSYAWRGCFESLPYPMSVQDSTPSLLNPESLYVPSFAPDEPDSFNNANVNVNTYLSDTPTSCTPQAAGTAILQQERICKYLKPKLEPSGTYWNGPNDACNSQPLLRLTNNESAVTTEIQSLVAKGNTDLHEGVMWGWRTISPNGPLQDGAPYQSTDKAIILMTDGMNFYPVVPLQDSNGSASPGISGYDDLGYSFYDHGRVPVQANGQDYPAIETTDNNQQSPALDELTREACANARAAGIQIYTIGFQATDIISASGQQLLKDCVNDDPTHFFLVTDETSLAKAFSSVSLGVSAPRLVK